MKLIVNGDDYGLSMGVSKGIIESIKNGIMRDTTAMANMDNFEEGIKYALDNGLNEMGVHLTLTCGSPVLPVDEVKSIVREDGTFYKRIYHIPEGFSLEEIEKELRAQIEKFLKTGMKMNHLDGHHHFYTYYPEVFKLIVKLAKDYNVPMRCPDNNFIDIVRGEGVTCPDHFVIDFYEENVTEDYLINRLEGLKDKYEVVEIMAHPAYVDEDLMNLTAYNSIRDKEREVLTAEKVLNYIKENNIELVSFSSLK
ncbi:MAG: carbohydrate deacetylase [Clostridium sp.]